MFGSKGGGQTQTGQTGVQNYSSTGAGKILTDPQGTVGGILDYIMQIIPGATEKNQPPGMTNLSSGIQQQPNMPQTGAPDDRLAFLRAFNLQG